MAKHIFRIETFGVYDLGPFIRETAKCLFYEDQAGGERQASKRRGLVVVDTSDAPASLQAARKAWNAASGRVGDIEHKLRQAKEAREDACLAALKEAS